MWTLEIVFERQKSSAEGHSKTLSQSDLVFINPGIYLHSMATVIGKSAKTQFPAYLGEFWNMSQRLLEIYSWFYENMIDENYSSLLKLGQTRVIISPMSPKITAKREKRAREREREKKRLSTVFSFYSVDFGSRYIYIYIYIYIKKKT